MPTGDVVYLNATLATWLDHDLAQVGSGGLKLADIVVRRRRGAADHDRRRAGRGEDRGASISTSRRAAAAPCRCGCYHKVAFGADGAPGASRTLVLNRARDDGTDPQRAAEVRFMRFFHNTPMAIATVDKTASVARGNARFAKLAQSVCQSGAAKPFDPRGGRRARPRRARSRDRARPPQGRATSRRSRRRSPASGERWAQFFVTAGRGRRARRRSRDRLCARDHRAQRALENQVNQAQKMETVGQLAGGIAHDFNNVLSAIMMATDFLLNAHKPTDPSFQDIMQIKQNANRAASLVRQLLAFSRKQTLRPQVLDLGEALADLTMLLRRLIGEKVDARSRARPRPVAGEGRRLAVRAGRSSISRSTRATPCRTAASSRSAPPTSTAAECGAARTTRACRRPIMCWSRSPTPAPAFRADIIDKIFEPFFSTKEVGKGTGLGLSTVYGIVKQTGGFVYRRIRSSGKGTTFRIFLPRHIAGRRSRPTPIERRAGAERCRRSGAEPKPRADLTGQGTILLVEDEEGLARAQCARARVARLHGAGGRQRRRGDGGAGGATAARSISSCPTW